MRAPVFNIAYPICSPGNSHIIIMWEKSVPNLMERIFFQDWFVLIFLFLRNVKQTRFFAKACFLRIIDTVSSKSEEKTVDERIVVRIFLVLSLVLKMY